MTIFNRRTFLSAAVAAAGLRATSSWCSEWFLPQDPGSTARERQLRAAVAQAKAHGKPLLVFVVPAESEDGQAKAYDRGNWFGAFLNHGGSRALLEVALCVPACARLDEVRRVTGAAKIEGDPLLLLVDASGVGVAGAAAAKVTPLVLELGSPFGQRKFSPDEEGDDGKQHVEAGIEKLTQGLHQIVHQHGDSMASLAAAVSSRLSDGQVQALAQWLGSDADAPADALLVQAAAEVRRAMADLAEERRAVVQQRLLEAIEREVVKKPIAGARWYTSAGCGSEPEDPTPEEAEHSGMMACGMGMVPAHCDRFLALWKQ